MPVILFLIILVALILVHEFGHFIVAKLSKIRVDEFGIGFPPKLFGIKKGETEYTVNTLPFGGFVKIFGEDAHEEALSGPDSERSFVHKPAYIQAFVLVAGVGFNVLFAWFLLSLGFMMGIPSSLAPDNVSYASDARVMITNVLPDSPAAQAGLLAGDIVLAISSLEESGQTESPEVISSFIADRGAHKEPITLEVKREEVIASFTLEPRPGIIAAEKERPAIGISMDLVGTVVLPFPKAIYEGGLLTARLTGETAVGIVDFLKDAVMLAANFSQITGPVGIVGLVGEASALGFVHLIIFMAFISINLAIINLLPFPALDGGRLLFVIIETLKGSPIRPKVVQVLNTVGFVLLILLMVAVTYQDIARLAS